MHIGREAPQSKTGWVLFIWKLKNQRSLELSRYSLENHSVRIFYFSQNATKFDEWLTYQFLTAEIPGIPKKILATLDLVFQISKFVKLKILATPEKNLKLFKITDNSWKISLEYFCLFLKIHSIFTISIQHGQLSSGLNLCNFQNISNSI
jgi:hypothetical protein